MVYDLSFCTPKELSSEFLKYDTNPEQMAVGKAGKLGILKLDLERNESSNRTTIKNQYYRTPLCIKRALYLEETCPEMAYIYIISPSGGVLQGDRYRTDISLKNSALAHITTQSATRVYKMNNNFGTQIINLNVDKDCYLEYIPDQIIPFKNSRFYQVSTIKVHETSTCIYSEMLTPGRVARNESFEFDICEMKVQAFNQSDNIRFIDIAKIEPKKESVESFGIMANYEVIGNVYVIIPKEHINNIQDQILQILSKVNNVFGGCTKLPDENGLLVRLLGSFVHDVRNVIFLIVAIVRKFILNISFSGLRKA